MANDTWDMSGGGQAAGGAGEAQPLPERLGPFAILSELGRGTFGVVYHAREEGGREVALKVVTGEGNPVQLQRFVREGEVTAALNHPGIVRIHGAGELKGRPYLAYELVEGSRTLEDLLDEGPLEERIARVRDVARALGFAHARGITHRDVKPANVLVDPEGRVRVADFGLALADGAERLSRTGVQLGTPYFMAPEQFAAERERIGPTCDVWALGVLLYRVLTKEFPFEAHTILELGIDVATRAPKPPRAIDPTVPRALEAVCLEALSKEPEGRQPDGDVFAAGLEAWLARPLAGSAPGGVAVRWALLAGLAGSLAVFLGVLLQRETPNPTPPPSRTQKSPAVATTREPVADHPQGPEWYRRLEPRERPALPLPLGVSFGPGQREYRNGPDGGLLVWVPAGTYPIGEEQQGLLFAALPSRKHTLERGFFIGKTEVTWAQLWRYGRATGVKLPTNVFFSTREGKKRRIKGQGADPVYNITWRQAQAYCRWAGGRLPSELEWECAARGPRGNIYPWGDVVPTPKHMNGRSGEDGFEVHSPVGSFPLGASPFGCLDMSGNVWEWTLEESEHKIGFRIVRGGSRRHYRATCRGSYRASYDEDKRDWDVGFRFLREHR